MGRTCPDLDAELFFDADEIRSAYLLTEVKQPAKPKLNQVLRFNWAVDSLLIEILMAHLKELDRQLENSKHKSRHGTAAMRPVANSRAYQALDR